MYINCIITHDYNLWAKIVADMGNNDDKIIIILSQKNILFSVFHVYHIKLLHIIFFQ